MTSPAILRTQGSYTRRSGELLFGGSPWGLARLSAPARSWARGVLRPGAGPVLPVDEIERATARLLVDRGLALPVLPPRPPRPEEIEIVVPVHGPAAPLRRLLGALAAAGPDRLLRVTVVDDASAEPDAREISRACADHQARLVVLPQNLGPGGARNAGLAATTAELVAFLDADTVPPRDWLDRLVPHFEDPGVAAVAPRVRGTVTGSGTGSAAGSVLERFEARRGGLDLGPHARRVAPGGQVGYVPTAALVVRRAALPDPPFEPGLRVGEDVDLVWRLVDSGWTVRYVPGAEVHHEVRSGMAAWARRHAAYGSSAVPLDRRHPGRLAPATLGWPGLALLAGATVAAGGGAAGRAVGSVTAALGLGVQVGASVRRFRRRGLPSSAGAEIALLGLRSEATAIGHALRREWWPLGAAAVVLSLSPVPRARAVARAAVVLGMLPTLPDTVRAARHAWQDRKGAGSPADDAGAPLDPARHLALRLAADAAYGTGVIRAAVRSRHLAVLLPRLRGRSRG
ncbi:mycofactocin system glycosyltransferase [Cellulosimicrobium funkei]|nr:mycofactocin system glycosyltransferase [Cellulosimicrobium funkei]